jgi:transcriptional regulator with XRE-family HTH domain
MDSTIGMRIKQLREAKQMTVADFAKAAGVKPSAIYGLEGGANKPSIETVAMLRKSFPDLNTEWLQFGDGSMYKGAELTPAPAAPSPETEKPTEGEIPERKPDYTSAPATVAEAENLLLKEQVADLKADKARLLYENDDLRETNKKLLEKPFPSSDATDGSQPVEPRPEGPQPILSVQHRRRAGFRQQGASLD